MSLKDPARPEPQGIRTDGKVACGALPWRYGNRLRLTVVTKATLGLVPRGVATLLPPTPLTMDDRYFGRHVSHSLEAPTDFVPHLARCDVLVVGHAYSYGAAASPVPVRLTITRGGRPVLAKGLFVYGDCSKGGVPAPFERIPLLYERAMGGPGQPNPIGTATPNLVDPSDPRRPISLGPIAKWWPVRAGLLKGEGRKALEAPVPEVPEAMQWAYFQAAPADQQIEYLVGGEWLSLEGLHPTERILQTCLPMLRGAVRLRVSHANGPTDVATDMVCDRLVIEPDRNQLTLTWRGHWEVPGGEAALSAVVVFAGLEMPGAPVAWQEMERQSLPKSSADMGASSGAARPKAAADLQSTTGLSPDEMAAAAIAPSMPFAAAPGTPPPRPSNLAATPWGAEPLKKSPAPTSQKGTLAIPVYGDSNFPEASAPKGIPLGTVGLSDAEPRIPTPVLPFASGNAPQSMASPVSLAATPWGAEPIKPAPAPSGKGTIVLQIPEIPIPNPAVDPQSPPSPLPPPPPTVESAASEKPSPMDPWARPTEASPRDSSPAPLAPPPPGFERPTASAFKGSVYGKFVKR